MLHATTTAGVGWNYYCSQFYRAALRSWTGFLGWYLKYLFTDLITQKELLLLLLELEIQLLRQSICEPALTQFSNSPIIIRSQYVVSGSDTAQIGWVEVATEDGTEDTYGI